MNLRNIYAYTAFLLTTTMFVSPALAGFEPMLQGDAAYMVKEVENKDNASFSIYNTEKKTETFIYKDKDGAEKEISVEVIELAGPQHYQYEKKEGLTSGATEEETADGKKDVTAVFANQEASNKNGLYENTQTINELKAQFIDNESTAPSGAYPSSALRNSGAGNIAEVKGDFINNKVTEKAWLSDRGAISNTANIGNIQGNFINNSVVANTYMSILGAAITNEESGSHIGTIENSAFIGNSLSTTRWGGGGAISNNNSAKIDAIKNSLFSENSFVHPTDTYSGRGGAIYNSQNTQIGEISGNTFILNSANVGGAIMNENNGAITTIKDNVFIENKAVNNNGGAIYNGATIGDIENSVFVKNTTTASGGAIYTHYQVHNINGDFIENEAAVRGAAIDNYAENAKITGTISGNFIRNGGEARSVIDNSKGAQINQISANFIDNKATAVYNSGEDKDSTINNIKDSVFVGNTAKTDGGAIYNGTENGSATINKIDNAVFVENTAKANGGAIYNDDKIGLISASFVNNTAEEGRGGAIYSTKDLTIAATDSDVLFSGNTDSTGSNAIYLDGDEGGQLELSANNGTKLVVDDGIDSKNAFDLSVGQTYRGGEVVINNEVKNVANIEVIGSTLSLGENASLGNDNSALPAVKMVGAELNLANGKTSETHIGSLNSLRSDLRVDVDLANKQADMLYVHGNVEGRTNVILDLGEDASPTEAMQLAFVQSENDMTGNADSFSIYRMMRSPFDVDVAYVQTGENKNQWLLDMDGEEPKTGTDSEQKPDSKPFHRLTPEALTYLSLPTVVIEQSRYVSKNVLTQAEQNTFAAQSDKPKTWVDVHGRTANYDKKLDIDADIWGLDAGATLGGDASNSYGAFASYRNGDYGIGHKFGDYYSKTSSKVDASSYLLGGYYVKKCNNITLAANLFAGRQSLDVKTHDGVSSKTSANELGFGARAYGFAYQNDAFGIKPFAGLSYHYYDIKSLKDDFGKQAAYDDLSHLELELGAQFAYDFKNGFHAYLTPSLIDNITHGDSVKITNLDKVNSAYEDDLLVRTEFGLGYDFSEHFNVDAYINYTYGANYDAISAGLDIKYLFQG